ncbi:unnamed protein product [Linum trigynum]|uniref:Uncharacterized protein n=1 Tax=Linum trigynum TaxID=586398 RepID=A0AAV2CY41_9ROSI
MTRPVTKVPDPDCQVYPLSMAPPINKSPPLNKSPPKTLHLAIALYVDEARRPIGGFSAPRISPAMPGLKKMQEVERLKNLWRHRKSAVNVGRRTSRHSFTAVDCFTASKR